MSQDRVSYAPVKRTDDAALTDGEAVGEKSAPNPLLIVHSLLRGRYVITIVLATVAAAACAVIGYSWTEPTYQSVGLVAIKPTVPSVSPNSPDAMMPAFGAFFASQMQYLESERVVTRAMEKPEWQQVRPGLTPPQIAAFRGHLSVVSPKGTHLIRVGFTDKDPAVAMTGVKCVINSYIELYKETDTSENIERVKIYERVRIEQGNRVDALEKEIADIAGTHVDAESIHKLYLLSLEETTARESAWNEVKRILGAVDVTNVAPDDAKNGAPGAEAPSPATRPASLTPEEIALNDRHMQSLLDERRQAQQEVRLLRVRLGPANPHVIQAQKRVEMAEEDIAAHAKKFPAASLTTPSRDLNQGIARTQAEMELQGLRVKEKNLRLLHEESSKKTVALGERLSSIQARKRLRDEAKRKYDDANNAIQRMDFQASLGGRISAESLGDKPLQPFEDNRLKLAAGGAFGGAAIPVLLMLGIGFLNRKLVTVGDVRLGLHHVDRVLGVLPQVPDNLGDTEQAAVAAHCVHHIRTLLQLEPGLPPRRVYALTSPSPGDGKTTLSIALGMSFAASGARTLLLDCDIIGGGLSSKMDQLIRPKIGRVLRREGLINDEQLQQALQVAKDTGKHVGDVLIELGYVSDADVAHAAAVQAQSYVGLLDVLAGESLADCVTGTGRPGLFILPIGSADPHHAAHLSPAALHRVLVEARAAFDVVLIDTGPILGSLEASMVAAQADAVVLTVSSGVPQALVRRALDRLVEVGANIAGMVLNRAAAREVADFAFSSGSARSANRRLPAPDAVTSNAKIRLGTVGKAMESSTSKSRR